MTRTYVDRIFEWVYDKNVGKIYEKRRERC